MYNYFFTFFENMSVIIAALYLITKLADYLISNERKTLFKGLAPLLFGVLAVLVMLHPFVFANHNILDLRYVPIYAVAIHSGGKKGVLVLVLPIIYRFYMGGPFAIDGIIFSIILPFIVGVIAHNRVKTVSETGLINKKIVIYMFLIYEVIRVIVFFTFYNIPLHLLLVMVSMSVITLFIISTVMNDGVKNNHLKGELLKLARYDHLTNLPNVRYFKEQTDKLLKNGEDLAIAMVDIDFFKQYNDKHGHPIGDIALQCVGNLLDLTSREKDIVARYGGEEFVICLRKANNPEEINQVLENFRKVIELYLFPGESTKTKHKLTISIGVSHSNYSKELYQLIDQADQALYESKKNNRNTVTFYQQ
jgi:diguanylate cyclase